MNNSVIANLIGLKSKVASRMSWKTGGILLAALAAILVLVPRSGSFTKAESCPNPPGHAVLNYWPVSFDQSQTGCTDFTTLDGKIVGTPRYSTSQADHDDGLQVADGQEVYMLAYVHNGAAVNGDPNQTTARNVRFNVQIPTSAGSDHTINASWRGDNTNTASGSFTLHTPANRTVELVPNSGQLFDAFGNQISSGIDLSSGSYTLGDQTACFEYARFLRFKVRMGNPPGTPALTITKQVRNVTQNGTFSGSANAITGNTVGYQIKVKNTGTAPALATTVQDNGTPGTTYVNGSLQVSNGGTGSGIPGTITLGTLAPNEEVTITYSATVTGGNGTYTNTATAQATSVPSVNASATVTVTNIPTSDNAECISVSLNPQSPFDAGQSFTGTVRVRNNGTTTWTSGTYSLGAQPNDNRWGVDRVNLVGTVPPGGEATFTISTQAPSTPGTYSFGWQMVNGNTYFGPVCSTPVVVRTPPVTTDNAECVAVSLAPASPLDPNQGFTGTIKVRNSGTTTWVPANGYALGSQNPANNTTWGTNRISLPISVAPGQEVIMSINTQAPATPGTYNFAWQMVKNGNFFGATCATPVVVKTPPVLTNDAQCIAVTLNPASPFDPNQGFTGSIKVRNIGTTTWVPANGYALGSQNPQDNNTWGTNRIALPYSVAPGQEVIMSINTQAPATPGTYSFAWKMVQNGNFFGPTCETPVVVKTPPVLTDNAECIATTLSPVGPYSPNQGFIGTIRVRNSGTTTWAPGTYAIGSQNPQDNTTWGTNRITLNSSVAPGGEATFTISTQAPANAGTYSFAWQMVKTGAFFGAVCQTNVVVQNVVPQTTTLSITKYVRNLTDNTSFEKTVNADNGDRVQYEVKIRNIGDITANDVIMTDNGTSGTSFVSGSIEITGTSNLWSGTIPGTLNLGNLAKGAEITIRYTMTVTGGNGTYTNTATADASNTASVFDTARVVVDQGCTSNCGGGGGGTSRRLSVDKLVRNLTTGTSYRDTTSASNGDRVQFEITVRNTSSARINDVELRDTLPSGLRLESGSIEIDGDEVSSNSLSSIDLGNLAARDEKVVTLIAIVDRETSGSCSTRSLQNIARATGDNARADQDDASVTVGCVQGSNVNLSFAKRAWNDTKNVDATTTTASREDFITYTLTVTNTGNSTATNFVITDDLSGVLPYADMVDRNGGTLNGNVLSFPGMNIPAGATVTKTFKVRIKHNLSQSLTYQLQNTYGNTVTINVGSVQGTSIFVAPTTGAAGTSAAAFAGLMTLGFVAYRKREFLKRLIMA